MSSSQCVIADKTKNESSFDLSQVILKMQMDISPQRLSGGGSAKRKQIFAEQEEATAKKQERFALKPAVAIYKLFQKSHTVYLDWRELGNQCFHSKLIEYWTEERKNDLKYVHCNWTEGRCWITFSHVDTASDCYSSLLSIQANECNEYCEFKICHLQQNAADFLYLLRDMIEAQEKAIYSFEIRYYLEHLQALLLGAEYTITRIKYDQAVRCISATKANHPPTVLKLLRALFNKP